MPNLESLSEQWLIAKSEEKAANERRIAIEDEIIALAHNSVKEEGTVSIPLQNGMTIKVTGKLTYKADANKLSAATLSWPETMRPVETVLKQSDAMLKLIRSTRSDLWRQLSHCVTVKPAKTAIKVEEGDNGI